MPFRDLLRHGKDKDKEKEKAEGSSATNQQAQQPQFTFIRTTTNLQEEITPPSFPGDNPTTTTSPTKSTEGNRSRSSTTTSRFRKHSNSLSEKLHLRSARSTSSVHLPDTLPDAPTSQDEAEWEKRATLLAKSNSISRSVSPAGSASNEKGRVEEKTKIQAQSYHGVSDGVSDENIQEAIRLHEAGDLARSTEMFGRLANPTGANNALAQVLYGLALRHGWGISKDLSRGITYLQMAASNSAEIETQALNAGMSKGGAAKGELTLAIFELANCFRNGWGVKKDPAAARQYYETAANMGDTDAMNEVAWCWMEGFGCKKDKFKAAQYLRLAEEKGAPTVGNAWIWKDKYGGPKKTVTNT